MPDPADAKRDFLDVTDAEIVDGPGVIAGKVSDALEDADRFGMPSVKPPLAEALDRARDAGAAADGAGDGEQDALSGKSAGVDHRAGSAEVLKPAERDSA